MKFIELAVTLGLAWFLAANLAGSLLVLAAARVTRDVWTGRPAARARLLLALRVAPTVIAGLFVTVVFAPAFWHFEPRDTVEAIGPVLFLLALAAIVLLGSAVRRGVVALRHARQQAARWMAGASPLAVDDPLPAFTVRDEFPVVSLVGLARPQLFIARQVVERLTPAELQATVAHEIGHRSSWDNLKRLAFICCPDALAFGRPGRALQQEWVRLTELAADAHATAGNGARRLDLASALVKVARLAPVPVAASLPYSSLHDGGDIAARVRRLAAGPVSPADGAPAFGLRAGLALVVALALALACSHMLPYAVQQASESLVRFFA